MPPKSQWVQNMVEQIILRGVIPGDDEVDRLNALHDKMNNKPTKTKEPK